MIGNYEKLQDMKINSTEDCEYIGLHSYRNIALVLCHFDGLAQITTCKFTRIPELLS